VYTELINNTIASYLPASPTYCCYTTLGKQVNCIVITLATKVTHYRCTIFFKIQFIHTIGMHLSLISQQGFKMFFLIHTGLKSLTPFINIAPSTMFWNERQSSAASGQPHLELAYLVHSILYFSNHYFIRDSPSLKILKLRIKTDIVNSYLSQYHS